MLTWVFYVLVLAFLIVLFSTVFGPLFNGDAGMLSSSESAEESQARIAANNTAVQDGRFEDIKFDVVLRGYRQDQVDAVIKKLTVQEENS